MLTFLEKNSHFLYRAFLIHFIYQISKLPLFLCIENNAEIALTLSLIQNQITHYKIIATLTKVFNITFHNVFLARKRAFRFPLPLRVLPELPH